MQNIEYTKIDDEIKQKIIGQWGQWVQDWNCIPEGRGCYGVAATADAKIVGFAALGPQELTPPLNGCFDAYIMDIEVDEEFQRRGIGRTLAGMLEDWAKSYGYRQIRAWSSEKSVEAIHMWYNLNYCMCPAVMLGVSAVTGDPNEKVTGYYYAKMLNPK